VKLTLVHREGAAALAIAQAVQSMLNAAGFEVTLRFAPWQKLLEDADAQRLPLYLSRWVFDNGDAGSFLRDCVRTRHPPSPDGRFNAGYSNPKMDELIDASATEFDDHARLLLFQKIASLAQDDVPFVPLFHQPDIWGVARDLVWEPRLDGRLLAFEMSFGAPAIKPGAPGAS
jgi:peptide/nickel transport system substrate-binding protein